MFSNKETKEIFSVSNKKIEKNVSGFFQVKQTYDSQKFKISFFSPDIVLIFCYEIGIFGPYFFVSIFGKLSFESFTLVILQKSQNRFRFFINLVSSFQILGRKSVTALPHIIFKDVKTFNTPPLWILIQGPAGLGAGTKKSLYPP